MKHLDEASAQRQSDTSTSIISRENPPLSVTPLRTRVHPLPRSIVSHINGQYVCILGAVTTVCVRYNGAGYRPTGNNPPVRVEHNSLSAAPITLQRRKNHPHPLPTHYPSSSRAPDPQVETYPGVRSQLLPRPTPKYTYAVINDFR